MAKVTYEADVSSYHVMALDEVKPEIFSKIIIDGIAYESEPVLDASMAIAIIRTGNHNFIGKEVFFE